MSAWHMNIAQILEKFPAEEDCLAYLEMVRWNGRPICPYCKSDNSTALSAELRHHCNNCNTSFSVTVGTIFHHTHLPLQKWFLALMLVLSAKKNVSSRQLSRDLQVNRNTAWLIQRRIRDTMLDHGELLSGIVEMAASWNARSRLGGDRGPKLGSNLNEIVERKAVFNRATNGATGD
jgi:transposase-like protein